MYVYWNYQGRLRKIYFSDKLGTILSPQPFSLVLSRSDFYLVWTSALLVPINWGPVLRQELLYPLLKDGIVPLLGLFWKAGNKAD